jgi:hypothetical protein
MLTVIFGAGASYDSAPSCFPTKSQKPSRVSIEEARPPLANELFEDRPEFQKWMTRYPQCLPIIDDLRYRRGGATTVEQVLEEFQITAETYTPGQVQLVAIRYYLHCMLWECQEHWKQIHGGVTNYAILLDRINRQRKPMEKVCLVTFNYDTMLEDALSTLGFIFPDVDAYVSATDYQVIKYHGSINWGREIETSGPGAPLTDFTGQRIPELVLERAGHHLKLSDRFRIATSYPMTFWDRAALFPALAIPVETKKSFECPENHLRVVEDCIKKTDRLLIVGWRAADAPFAQLLAKNLSPHKFRTLVVSGNKSAGQEAVDNLARAEVKFGMVESADRGFTGFIRSDDLSRFLSGT